MMYCQVLSGMVVAFLLGFAVPVQAESPMRLDAGGLEIEDHALPPPESERHGPLPSSVLERWSHEQLGTTGNGPPVRFIILDASVNMEKLPLDHGFNAMFKDQQDRKLIAHLKARLEYQSPQRTTRATAEAIASVTVAQSASPSDLDAAYAIVLGIAADSFAQRMKGEIRAQFGDLIVP
jgi:hypothetical protein